MTAAPIPVVKAVARPVAKPVARAVPISADSQKDDDEPRPTPVPPITVPPTGPTATSPSSFPAPKEVEHHRAQPQVKMAFLVVAGMLMFGCCGIGVVGYAFMTVAKSISQSDDSSPSDHPTQNDPPRSVPVQQPKPKTNPIEPPLKTKFEPTKPSKAPPTTPLPPPPPRDNLPAKLNVPSPQGMKGLQAYVSFDNPIIRDDVSRTKLPVNQTVLPILGARNRAASLFVTPLPKEDTPKFVVDGSSMLDLFRYKDDAPFTISLWMRSTTNEGVAFALTQNSLELGPKLLFRTSSRRIDVELYCDEDDSEKKFVRSKSYLQPTAIGLMHHVVLTRGKDGLLSVFIDAEKIDEAPAGSLPAKQPVDLSFKQAGFALQSKNIYSLVLDEFSAFDRALSADEIKTLSGRGKPE